MSKKEGAAMGGSIGLVIGIYLAYKFAVNSLCSGCFADYLPLIGIPVIIFAILGFLVAYRTGKGKKLG